MRLQLYIDKVFVMKTQRPSEAAITAWTRLVRTSTQLHAKIEQSLKHQGLPPLSWYDVLIEVHRAGKEGLRQFEISNKTLLPKYNLSRLIDRLELEGLVRRETCSEDGRGNLILITDEGTEVLKRMWPVYGSEIYEGIEECLEPEEVLQLAQLLEKLASGTQAKA